MRVVELLMRKYWLFLIIICWQSVVASELSIAPENEIEVGGVLYHLRELYDGKRGNYGVRNYLKPVLIFSHQGWLAGYFKNSHQRNSYVVGMRRYWPSSKYYGDYHLMPGFAVGMVSGYCKGKGSDIYDDCSDNRKSQLVPYGQLFLKFKKDNWSFNVSYSFVLVYLTASYYPN